jgi:hypothetical protein
VELHYGSHYVCLSAGGPLWEKHGDEIDWKKYATIWPPREASASRGESPDPKQSS